MANISENNTSGSNPLVYILGAGAGAIALIALGVSLGNGPTGAQVGVAESPTETQLSAGEDTNAPRDAEIDPPMSGENARPQDTDELTTVVGMSDGESNVDMETPAGLSTDLVEDPDQGAKQRGTTEGDMGAFYPTPSGPEGRDGDPFTAN